MHTTHLRISGHMYTPEFKAKVMSTLLFSLSATDISSRYGVPPVHVRRWIRELVVHLFDIYAPTAESASPPKSQMDKIALPLPGLRAFLPANSAK